MMTVQAQPSSISRADFIAAIKQRLDDGQFLAVRDLARKHAHEHPTVAQRALSAADREEALLRERDAAEAALRKQSIPDVGYYTVVLDGNTNDYVTFWVRRQDPKARFAPGKLLINRLTGPDNSSDYQAVALAPTDHFPLKIFKNSADDQRLVRALTTLVADPETAGQSYALRSSRCRRCGRRLTVPASLFSGYGPDCAGKV